MTCHGHLGTYITSILFHCISSSLREVVFWPLPWKPRRISEKPSSQPRVTVSLCRRRVWSVVFSMENGREHYRARSMVWQFIHLKKNQKGNCKEKWQDPWKSLPLCWYFCCKTFCNMKYFICHCVVMWTTTSHYCVHSKVIGRILWTAQCMCWVTFNMLWESRRQCWGVELWNVKWFVGKSVNVINC